MNVIVSVFVPEGVVLGTLAINELIEKSETEESIIYKDRIIDYVARTKLLFGRFGIVHYGDIWVHDHNFLQYLDEFEIKYEHENVQIDQLPDLLLDYFSEWEYSALCYLAGYKTDRDGKFEQHVYMISFSEKKWSRINQDKESKPIYYFHICGQNQLISRIFGNIKILQGDRWIDTLAPQIHFRNFSIAQSKNFVLYILNNITDYHNLLCNGLNQSHLKEMVLITRKKTECIEVI